MTPLPLYTSVEPWIALAIVFALPPITIRLARSVEFGAWRLAVGYLLALLPLVLLTVPLIPEPSPPPLPPTADSNPAAKSFIGFCQGWSLFHDHLPMVLADVLAVGVIGISLVLVPLQAALHRAGMPVAPGMLLTAPVIAVVVAVLIRLPPSLSSSIPICSQDPWSLYATQWVALVIGFVLGARLPWRATITRPRAEGVASNSDRMAMIRALGDAPTGPPSGH